VNASPIYHDDIAQHSDEWYAMKAGKWSSSCAATIMGGLGTKGLDDLCATIAWERVHGPVDEARFQSAAMRRGNELEPEARDWLAFNHDVSIAECGFVEHARIANVGWSPDGIYLPHRKRAPEIKCLLHKAYMEVLSALDAGKRGIDAVPSEYRWQCRWGIWVGDLDGLDFTVYHPRASGIVIPVERDRNFEDQMEARVQLLEGRVSVLVDRLLERKAAA
jgi:hypothetical protein